MRAALFWGVCMPVRAGLALFGDAQWLRLLALVIGTRWVTGQEKGVHGFFGGPAWWADQRAVHGYLWLGYALSGRRALLVADTAFGAGNWVRAHM
tara:strand:- start:883 stop:1167 length:285 start_codon:yes stop_codon:yes gene_type:complete